MKKAYTKPAMREIKLEPCRMMAQSGGGAVKRTNDGMWTWNQNGITTDR